MSLLRESRRRRCLLSESEDDDADASRAAVDAPSPLRSSPRLAAHAAMQQMNKAVAKSFVQINLFGRKPSAPSKNIEFEAIPSETRQRVARAAAASPGSGSVDSSQLSSIDDQADNDVEGMDDYAEHMPELNELERVRAKKRKAPEGPRGRAKAGRTTKETSVSLKKRLEEFPDEGLVISAGELFCGPCKESISNLKEGMRRHFKTRKHMVNKSKMLAAKQSSRVWHNHLANYFANSSDEQGVREP